ncbi:uncharacterized protein LOC127242596 [Andrographis paniculata]|uniref:uncharacterized protein LOC127242596 n=1 Tax=Andrographis paniculata TaxID=175694 RepID=UPI0021E9006E|nr:uncharacterized protein LOC127242596 [Andrographis paniculata]
MGATVNILCVVLFFAIVTTGTFQQFLPPCEYTDIDIRQNSTGDSVSGKPEFNVTITSPCPCPLNDVALNCQGFHTTTVKPRDVLSKHGGVCKLNKGGAVAGGGVTTAFTYAAAEEYQFSVNTYQFHCNNIF